MAKKNGRKNGKRKNGDSEPREFPVSTEALRGVSAVLAVAVGLFLALAAFNIGGAAGAFLYGHLSTLLGIGYMLLPLSLILLAAALMRSFQNRFGAIEIVSVVVFSLSALGLVSVIFPERGGILGSLIVSPLVAAVDTVATVIFLIAFIVAALIIAFDVRFDVLFGALRARMRPSTETAEGDVSIAGLPEEDEEAEDEMLEEEEVPDAVEEPQKPDPTPRYADTGDAQEGEFPIIAASTSVYSPPPLSLLGKNKGKPEVGDVKANMNILKRTLQNFGIQVEMDEVSIGPTVTRYAMKPAEGVRLSKIVALQSNLELALAASPVRIEAPIPGKSLVGIEVPNIARTTLGLAPLFSDSGFTQSDKPLLIGLGRSITGQAHFADLARMPHLLIAGTTGSGKSVCVHDIIVSLLYRAGPERLRFIMVDPKRVELTLYNSIPHLLTPVITDAKKAILALKWLAREMERRYNVLETERVRDIASYHENVVAPALEKASGGESDKPLPEAMPYIVLIIDELADIMQAYPRELEAGIVRLAQMSRAVGIHLILSTQRPSVKVITGLIKANIPARIAFQVASQIDSRTILDAGGAEKLLGAGDMLFLSNDMSKPRRIQAPFISEGEVKRVVSYIAKNNDAPLSGVDFSDAAGASSGPNAIFSAMEDEADDDKYAEAKRAVVEAGKASTSYLQRKLGIGYSRAARLMDMLEERGVIGPGEGSKPREVIGAGNADELVAAAEEEEDEFNARA
ncbi:MAG TPA: DNA translocase FtsK [Candidatus Paceibacterota bacterium]|nr:DNA translocase FtsK [Candidatus Paceibacterota bacterium]